MNHMYENELLSEHQHGFVKNKSCITNLLETMDYLTWNEWKRTPSDVVFLDFAKAFDTVPHSRLLVKLKGYGVCEQLVKWTQAFLSKRVQRVVRGDFVSDWVEVTSGVPQGSVYGPTLFIIYVNDIPGMLSSLVKLYADDTKLLADVSSHEGKISLQSDLDLISSWSKDWLVKLNTSKCKVMHFGTRNNKYEYRLNERLLEETTTERDLGVCISNDLKWEHQCNKVAAKANRMLGVLRKTFISRDILLWKRLYLVYVRPLLEFAMPVWCPSSEGDIKTLEKVQKRATRIPYSAVRPAYEERCRFLGIDTLKVRRSRGDLIQKHKIVKGLESVKWCIEPMSVPSLYGHKSQYRREIVKTCENRYHFFNNRVVNDWNNLPEHITDSISTNIFKKSLDEFLKL